MYSSCVRTCGLKESQSAMALWKRRAWPSAARTSVSRSRLCLNANSSSSGKVLSGSVRM